MYTKCYSLSSRHEITLDREHAIKMGSHAPLWRQIQNRQFYKGVRLFKSEP